MFRTIALCVSGSMFASGDISAEETSAKSPSVEVQALMAIVSNRSASVQDRARAARRLGDLKERAAVDVLAAQLPGNRDLLTKEIVNALAEIGDPKVLPVLHCVSMSTNHGKLIAIIDGAIEHIAARQVEEAKQRKISH
jgi:hypothetical protein